MTSITSIVTLFFSVLSLTRLTVASLGDELPEFKKCLQYCIIISCEDSKYHKSQISQEAYKNLMKDEELISLFDKLPLGLHLKALGWSCQSNCDYQCQRLITIDRVEDDKEIHQFHGKWPFIRVFGIQELFSALFSVGNFIPNYWGFKLLSKHYKLQRERGNNEIANLYFSYALVAVASMCAWFFSTIFHLKDTWNRERLDYFFAGLTVLTGFYAINVRFFSLFKTQNQFKRLLLAVSCIFMYLTHVTKLLNDWSYTYNMAANVVVGIIQNILWVTLSVSQFKKVRNKHLSLIDNIKSKEINWTLTPILLVTSVIFGMSFELFDFPPVFDLIDAHAMWHFVTIWPTIFWYPYMVKDCEGLMDLKFD